MSVSDYISENWILILVLLGFAVSLISTVFMQKKTIRRMFALIIQVFILSVVVYIEFKIADANGDRMLRLILMAIRYSSTPLLVAQIIYAVAKNQKWYVFIPAAVFFVLDFVSIPTGIVFALDAEGELVRGPLGMRLSDISPDQAQIKADDGDRSDILLRICVCFGTPAAVYART